MMYLLWEREYGVLGLAYRYGEDGLRLRCFPGTDAVDKLESWKFMRLIRYDLGIFLCLKYIIPSVLHAPTVVSSIDLHVLVHEVHLLNEMAHSKSHSTILL
jgi:hypothetical protein